MYLWHWYPSLWIGRWLSASFGKTVLVQNAAMILSLALLVPLSALSYRWLEAPYFKNHLRST
jgi:peptidoglycan/LPS O-acetylase OafA/YrhL